MECIVVDNVTEILLGMNWLAKNVEVMDLKNRQVVITGKTISLKGPPVNGVTRRIQTREDVCIPLNVRPT